MLAASANHAERMTGVGADVHQLSIFDARFNPATCGTYSADTLFPGDSGIRYRRAACHGNKMNREDRADNPELVRDEIGGSDLFWSGSPYFIGSYGAPFRNRT